VGAARRHPILDRRPWSASLTEPPITARGEESPPLMKLEDRTAAPCDGFCYTLNPRATGSLPPFYRSEAKFGPLVGAQQGDVGGAERRGEAGIGAIAEHQHFADLTSARSCARGSGAEAHPDGTEPQGRRGRGAGVAVGIEHDRGCRGPVQSDAVDRVVGAAGR